MSLPETVREDLSAKPAAQRVFKVLSHSAGRIDKDATAKKHPSICASLTSQVEKQIHEVLDALNAPMIFSNPADMGPAHIRCLVEED